MSEDPQISKHKTIILLTHKIRESPVFKGISCSCVRCLTDSFKLNFTSLLLTFTFLHQAVSQFIIMLKQTNPNWIAVWSFVFEIAKTGLLRWQIWFSCLTKGIQYPPVTYTHTHTHMHKYCHIQNRGSLCSSVTGLVHMSATLAKLLLMWMWCWVIKF